MPFTPYRSLLLIVTLSLGACSGSGASTSATPPAASQGSEEPPTQGPQTQAPSTAETQPSAQAQTGQRAAPEQPGNPGQLSAGQALQIVATIDAGEIAQGHVAIARATSSAVRNYALQLISDHEQSLERLQQFAAEHANMTLAPSDKSMELDSNSAALVNHLNAVDSGAFDKTYLQAQVDEHQRGLQLLQQQLIPAYQQGSDVQNQLINAANMVANHLERGRQLLASMQQQ